MIIKSKYNKKTLDKRKINIIIYDNDSQIQFACLGCFMKRFSIFLVFAILVPTLLLFSCSNSEVSDNQKFSIVCTGFSQYDFTKEILGKNINKFEVVYLFDNGADVHSFENDIGYDSKIKIMSSDIFIYNGGESDDWVSDILNDKSMNKKCVVLSLLDSVDHDSLIEVGSQEHLHYNESEENHSHNSIDEHVWLSIKNAVNIVNTITEAIVSIDKESEATYRTNAEEYCHKIQSLHEEFQSFVSELEDPFVVIADRFPFAYMFNDFNISYAAAFSGCTSETEAIFENIVSICNEVSNHNITTLITIEKSNSNILNAVISASKKNLDNVTLNSLQSVSAEEIENGLTYFDVMKSNFDSLKKALKQKAE